MAAPTSGSELPSPAYQIAMLPKIAESAIRSQEESRNAPQRLLVPRARAMRPSSMSLKTKQRDDERAEKKTPRVKKAMAAADTPMVPTTVTTSGESPDLR